MRQIGNLPQQAEAVRFASYLVTQGIDAHSEEDGEQWTIWVREEDQLPRARNAMSEFIADPGHSRYRDAERAAEVKLREETSRREAIRKNVVQMRDKWGTGHTAQRRPLTIAVIVLCSALGLASGFGKDGNNSVLRTLMFRDPQHAQTGGRGETLGEKLVDVRRGQLWRIVTPAFLHGDVMHLAFNMVMFYQLGAAIERRRGTWRLGVMILAIASISNLAQALIPHEWGGTWNFVGLSGVVYGQVGYVWMKSRYQPELGLHLSQTMIVFVVILMLLGFAGFFPRWANWAHGVGFLSGYLIGIAPFLLRVRPKS